MSPKPLRAKILFLNLMNTFMLFILLSSQQHLALLILLDICSPFGFSFSPTSLASSQDFCRFFIPFCVPHKGLPDPFVLCQTFSLGRVSFKVVAQIIIHVLVSPNSESLVQNHSQFRAICVTFATWSFCRRFNMLIIEFIIHPKLHFTHSQSSHCGDHLYIIIVNQATSR